MLTQLPGHKTYFSWKCEGASAAKPPSLLSILTFLWSVSVGLPQPHPGQGTGPELEGRYGRSWLSGKAGCVPESGGGGGSSSCGPDPREPRASCTKWPCQTSRARAQRMRHSVVRGTKQSNCTGLQDTMTDHSKTFNITRKKRPEVKKKKKVGVTRKLKVVWLW